MAGGPGGWAGASPTRPVVRRGIGRRERYVLWEGDGVGLGEAGVQWGGRRRVQVEAATSRHGNQRGWWRRSHRGSPANRSCTTLRAEMDRRAEHARGFLHGLKRAGGKKRHRRTGPVAVPCWLSAWTVAPLASVAQLPSTRYAKGWAGLSCEAIGRVGRALWSAASMPADQRRGRPSSQRVRKQQARTCAVRARRGQRKQDRKENERKGENREGGPAQPAPHHHTPTPYPPPPAGRPGGAPPGRGEA